MKPLLYEHSYAHKRRAPIDLSLSENPLGCSPRALEGMIDAMERVNRYPDEKPLIDLIAQHHRINAHSIILGAGANGLLEDFLKVFAIGKGIIVPAATFPESVACMASLQGAVDQIPLNRDFTLNLERMVDLISPKTACIHLCNPNNPTGIWTNISQLHHLADHSSVPLLISEAGADYIGESLLDYPLHPNIIVVRSFSKSYGLAGLRIGYLVAHSPVIDQIKANLRSYRVNLFAIAAAMAALQDQEHLQRSLDYILKEKGWLICELEKLGFSIVPSQGQNFIAQVPFKCGSATLFCHKANQWGIAVVDCSLYAGLEKYIRISPQKEQTNQKFISILKKMMEEESWL